MKSTHVLSGTLALILGAVLSGCQPTTPAPAPDPGKLSITVTGLPAGTDAKVSVSGPSNFKNDLSASKTLEGLATGDYNVSATNVMVGSDTFSGIATPPTISVKLGETATSTVTYTKVPVTVPVPVNTGKLTVTVTGLPAGTDAKVSVSGPSDYKTDLSASKTLEGLVAGSYNVSATNITVGSDTFAGAATPPTVAVKAGETATSAVTYTKVPVTVPVPVIIPADSGKLSVTISGLPAGADAQVSVSGPNNFESGLISASKTLQGLTAGSYTISAVNVTVAGTSYPVTVTPTTVVVKGNTTSSATVVYKNPNLTFASYDNKSELVTAQGGLLFNYTYSEQANATTISAIVKTPISFSADYTLPSSGTNAYAGATVVVEGKPRSPSPTTDVTGFSKIRIQVASSAASFLQIKVAGSDDLVLNNGCYPVAVVPVTSALTAIVLDLNDATFALPGYCNTKPANEKKTLAETLNNVVRIEVEDNRLTAASKSSKTTIGTIEFLK